jgi:hypothetical protein
VDFFAYLLRHFSKNDQADGDGVFYNADVLGIEQNGKE